MELVQQNYDSPTADAAGDENERLIASARDERVRHEAILRRADRRIRNGLDLIRRGTLRVVSR